MRSGLAVEVTVIIVTLNEYATDMLIDKIINHPCTTREAEAFELQIK